jgi:hypothetical protein
MTVVLLSRRFIACLRMPQIQFSLKLSYQPECFAVCI